MAITSNNPGTHHSSVRRFSDPTSSTPRGRASVKVSYSYSNTTGKTIVVANRTGLKFEIKSSLGEKKEFVVTMEIGFDNEVKKYLAGVLSAVDESSSEALQVFRDAFAQTIQPEPISRAYNYVSLEFPIDVNELEKYGGVLYLHDVDVCIGFANLTDEVIHPESMEGIKARIAYSDAEALGGRSMPFVIDLVDNEHVLEVCFMNIAGNVYPVFPISDTSRKSGVYLTAPKSVEAPEGVRKGELVVTYSKDIESFGIYGTFAKAKANGDISRQMELKKIEFDARVLEQKHENEILKAAAEQDRIQFERRERELLAEHEARKRERDEAMASLEHMREIERAKAKDIFEDRSYARKDSSETIKFIPAIVVGLGAIFAACASIF